MGSNSNKQLVPIIAQELGEVIRSEGKNLDGFIHSQIMAGEDIHRNVNRIISSEEESIITDPNIRNLRNQTNIFILRAMQKMFPHLESNEEYAHHARDVAGVLGVNYSNQICVDNASEIDYIGLDRINTAYKGKLQYGGVIRDSYSIGYGGNMLQSTALKYALGKSDEFVERRDSYLARKPNVKICNLLIKKGIVELNEDRDYRLSGISRRPSPDGVKWVYLRINGIEIGRSLDVWSFKDAVVNMIEKGTGDRRITALTTSEKQEVLKMNIQALYMKQSLEEAQATFIGPRQSKK